MNKVSNNTRNVEIRMKNTRVENVFDLKLHHVYETVVSVNDLEGVPHHAPIGIRMLGFQDNGNYELDASIFTTAKMFDALQSQQECTIHFPGYDQLQFYFLAFHDLLKDEIEDIVKNVGKADTIDAPVLLDIKNYMETRVLYIQYESVDDEISASSESGSRRGIFSLESTRVVVRDPNSIPVSRHSGLLLEFMVKASRLPSLISGSEIFMKTRDELKKMLEKMESLAPGDKKNTIAAILLGKIDDEKY